jgi:signal transduction histidine kinase
MGTTDDQNAGNAGNAGANALSPTSLRMLALRERVLAQWEQQLRASVDPARGLSHPLLIDTLPAFYDNIAAALSPGCARLSGVDGSTIATEHGGERARLTAYDYDTLVREYQLFRCAIFEVLYADGLQLSPQEVLAINGSIDVGIQQSLTAFSLVHAALRERFAAALTHDLRGPLGATSIALELILMADDPARMKSLAGRALDNVRRMDKMIQDLLHTMAFHSGARLDLEMSSFDILELASEVQADAVSRGLGVELAGQALRGWWDRASLTRALENIVGNAAKYGRPGAPIRISVTSEHQRLLLSVHNQGDTIPPEEQECIFQLYRRAGTARSTHQQGWGIGLPYVRAVAESHGGSITLDSTAERGTTFTINIPVDARPLSGSPTGEALTD